MANKNIDNFSAAGALDGTEMVEVLQSGVNKRTTTQAIADLSPTTDVSELMDKETYDPAGLSRPVLVESIHGSVDAFSSMINGTGMFPYGLDIYPLGNPATIINGVSELPFDIQRIETTIVRNEADTHNILSKNCTAIIGGVHFNVRYDVETNKIEFSKLWRGLISQSGSDDPVLTEVGPNDFAGLTLTGIRSDAGQYNLTFLDGDNNPVELFSLETTLPTIHTSSAENLGFPSARYDSASIIRVQSVDLAIQTLADSIMSNNILIIEIFYRN